jgi:hypothetical protein
MKFDKGKKIEQGHCFIGEEDTITRFSPKTITWNSIVV